MSIKLLFSEHQEIWDDCYFGYIITDNICNNIGQVAIKEYLDKSEVFNFYPWLKHPEEIIYPVNGLKELNRIEFGSLFLHMAREAIAYGSSQRLSEQRLEALLDSFLEGFTGPKYFSNFTVSSWSPVTTNSKDSFLCAADKSKIGMWLSCNNE